MLTITVLHCFLMNTQVVIITIEIVCESKQQTVSGVGGPFFLDYIVLNQKCVMFELIACIFKLRKMGSSESRVGNIDFIFSPAETSILYI